MCIRDRYSFSPSNNETNVSISTVLSVSGPEGKIIILNAENIIVKTCFSNYCTATILDYNNGDFLTYNTTYRWSAQLFPGCHSSSDQNSSLCTTGSLEGLSFTTEDGVNIPGEPRDFKGSTNEPYKIKWEWKRPHQNGQLVTHFKIKIFETNVWEPVNAPVGQTNFTHTITYANANQIYGRARTPLVACINDSCSSEVISDFRFGLIGASSGIQNATGVFCNVNSNDQLIAIASGVFTELTEQGSGIRIMKNTSANSCDGIILTTWQQNTTFNIGDPVTQNVCFQTRNRTSVDINSWVGPFQCNATNDFVAPTTTATGTTPPGGSSYTYGNWTNQNVGTVLTCNDNGSGCKQTLYCTDTTNSCPPHIIYTSRVDVSTIGTSYIRYYSIDNANNSRFPRRPSKNLRPEKGGAFTAGAARCGSGKEWPCDAASRIRIINGQGGSIPFLQGTRRPFQEIFRQPQFFSHLFFEKRCEKEPAIPRPPAPKIPGRRSRA